MSTRISAGPPGARAGGADHLSHGELAAVREATVTVADVGLVAQFAAQWPLRSFLELGALPGAVPCARLHARQVLWEWDLTAFSESTELLVSELITNAMRISCTIAQGTPVRLWLVSDRAQVVIYAWDATSLPPVLSDADDDAENGRGLLIVQAVSARWGWDFPPGMGGKVVWAQAQPV